MCSSAWWGGTQMHTPAWSARRTPQLCIMTMLGTSCITIIMNLHHQNAFPPLQAYPSRNYLADHPGPQLMNSDIQQTLNEDTGALESQH